MIKMISQRQESACIQKPIRHVNRHFRRKNIGPYEEPIPEDALLKNMLKWQDELKRRMEEDMNQLPQTINIERHFSFSQCLE